MKGKGKKYREGRSIGGGEIMKRTEMMSTDNTDLEAQ